jgi:hypothetical protein
VPAAETASPKLLADVGEELASRGLTGLGADGLAETVGATQRPVARALRELMGRREVVSIGDRFVDAATLEAAVGAACARLKDRPQTLGDLRDLWGVGRDRAVDIAEYMDSRGLSQRKGNARVAGPERFASDS